MKPSERKIVERLAFTFGDLQSWYQASIDETEPPIWTDEHLEELFKDFYLVPKSDKQ